MKNYICRLKALGVLYTHNYKDSIQTPFSMNRTFEHCVPTIHEIHLKTNAILVNLSSGVYALDANLVS